MKKFIACLTLAAAISIPALIAGGDCCGKAKDQATAKNKPACSEQAKASCPFQAACTEQAKVGCPLQGSCPVRATGTTAKGAERQKAALATAKAQNQGDIAKK